MTKISPFQNQKLRKQTGLSQKAFAQAVNLPIRTYRSYESGERGLTIDKFRKLKEKLGYYQECHKIILEHTSTICDLPSLVCGI